MSRARPRIAVTFDAEDRNLDELFRDVASVDLVAGLSDRDRARALEGADVLYAWNWRRELRPGEGPALGVRFVQLLAAGADHLPFDQLPPGALVASNVGAYAEPMAEHAVAMALSLLKRLPQNHALLAEGIWNQHVENRTIAGAECAILGFGGIGKATGRLLRALGARIHAVNTTGRTDEDVDFVGTLDDLDAVLSRADVVLITLPLTLRTRGLIGARELGQMRPDGCIVNVARGAIVDEAALYEHLRQHPDFSAAIDTWWIEPFNDGEFRVDHPFFELPNLLGSPHNSGMVPGVMHDATRRGGANILRFLGGQPVTGVVRVQDYIVG